MSRRWGAAVACMATALGMSVGLAAPSAAVPPAPRSMAHDRSLIVSGRVVDQAGRPVQGVKLVLEPDGAMFTGVIDGFFCLFSFGLAGEDVCGPSVLSGRSNGHGRFRFAMNPVWPVADLGA